MKLIAVNEEDFETLKQQLADIQNKLQKLQPSDDYWDNSDIIQKLKVSERTLATWREKGIIRYSKVGNKVIYRYSDVQRFLDENAVDLKVGRS